MLNKEIIDRIIVVAAINGGSISIQNLELIAGIYHVEDQIESIKTYCNENNIYVFDEVNRNDANKEKEKDSSMEICVNTIDTELIKKDDSTEEFLGTLIFSSDDTKEQIIEILKKLKLQEIQVISYRYGLVDGKAHTLAEVGEKYKISRERARLVEAKFLSMYGFRPRKRKKLKDFLDDGD